MAMVRNPRNIRSLFCSASIIPLLTLLMPGPARTETITDWRASQVPLADRPGGVTRQVSRNSLPRSVEVLKRQGDDLAFIDPATGVTHWVRRFSVRTDEKVAAEPTQRLSGECVRAGSMGMGEAC